MRLMALAQSGSAMRRRLIEPSRRGLIAAGFDLEGRRALAHLLRRADQDLVDRHVSWAHDDVENRVGDVLRHENLVEAAGSWLRTSSRTWVTSSLSVAPGSISDART